jgi:uncharacterized 2Fe-2S/4Fe-4S cluster protein (DUF4445 family)
VDLGTTTVVAQLLDLQTGQVLAVKTARNPQAAHGADLMSRLATASSAEGHAKLVAIIRSKIGGLIDELTNGGKPSDAPVARVVIAGNTVMHHLFSQLDIASLTRVPFDTENGGLQEFSAASLGWQVPGDPSVEVLPCLGGFVGGDILAGILATDLATRSELIGLVDLGTNGEIVIGNRDKILCTSTAAGPAFEGGRIRMGMQATTGAIDSVSIEGGHLCCHVLGQVAPRGICGSGLVDAVAVGLELGRIEPSGHLASGRASFPLAARVRLTQDDIRELQLAKGAIAAGVEILLERIGVKACDLDRLYLAGAFGNYVRAASARRIGLIEFDEDQIEAAGNTALLGAKLALFGEAGAESLSAVVEKVEHIPLATDAMFQTLFIEKTPFPN